MDLGVNEAYRHEAEVSVRAIEDGAEEAVTVRCDCGQVWESTREACADDDGPVTPWLDGWEAHVWASIRAAGQFAEAAENSAEASDDDGSRWELGAGEL